MPDPETPVIGVDPDATPDDTSKDDTSKSTPSVGDTWVTQHVPETLRNAMDWSKFDSLDSALKAHVELEKYRGGSLRVPASDAEDAEWTKLYDKLRPAQPEGYNVTYPTYDDKLTWLDDDKTWLTKTAHAIGLHERQLNAFVHAYAERQIAKGDEFDAQQRVEIDKIKGDFGPAYARNVALANRALKHLGGDDLLAEVHESGMGANPTFIRAMFKLGAMMAEDDTIVGDVDGTMSKEEAKSRLAEIKADRKSPLYDKSNPQRNAILDEIEKLTRIAYE